MAQDERIRMENRLQIVAMVFGCELGVDYGRTNPKGYRVFKKDIEGTDTNEMIEWVSERLTRAEMGAWIDGFRVCHMLEQEKDSK